jgi:hypothetical protein
MGTKTLENGDTIRSGARGGLEAAPNLARELMRFPPISLPELDCVALLDRVDTKYLVPYDEIERLIDALSDDYRVLEVDGVRVNRYRTVYFDTDGMDLYFRHHAGDRVRYKVRSREYVDSGVSFLELKRKTNKDRTVKERVRTLAPLNHGAGVDDFLLSRFPLALPGLAPRLTSEFSRATLAGKRVDERVTIDVDLCFSGNGGEASLPGVAIVEVKQAARDRGSPVMHALRSAGITPSGISKYCLGVALLYQGVKHNSFKPRLLQLEKLMRGDGSA